MLRLTLCEEGNGTQEKEQLSCRSRGYNLRGAKFTMPNELLHKTKIARKSRRLSANNAKLTPRTKAPVCEFRTPSSSLKDITVQPELSPDPSNPQDTDLPQQTTQALPSDSYQLSNEQIRNINRVIRQRYKVIVYRRKQRCSRKLDDLRMERVMTVIGSYFNE